MSRPRKVTPMVPGRRRQSAGPSPRRRLTVVVVLLGLASLGLVARAFDVQVVRKEFYQEQGDARFLREVPIAVSRGTILDRNGEPLAVSTPMVSITGPPASIGSARLYTLPVFKAPAACNTSSGVMRFSAPR